MKDTMAKARIYGLVESFCMPWCVVIFHLKIKTPKSFILKKGKVVDTIDGAYPYEEVIKKIDQALQ